ncbi:eukaryotic translation initiation factor 4E-like [Corticium candelabrum]|uniref:eukaryotic translation initiation factor 4E-like n=1 Tax=Corticium candelabrum TaxID=121492 RepID=UPI002E26C4BB|nr:eukaryotic translation initiation factor 4E-like [Corticium candelabrum]
MSSQEDAASPSHEEEQQQASSESPALSEESIKHPLQNTWALWFFKNDKTKSWKENLMKVTSFSTVEDFWGLYNYVQPASQLQPGCDYSVFKDGIEPAWEDSANRNGGRWLLNLNRQQRRDSLDRYWMEILLMMIGEQFEDASDEVRGAVVNIRPKGDKLALWTGHYDRREETTRIGTMLKERLQLTGRGVLVYQSHQDTMSKSGSQSRSLYQV